MILFVHRTCTKLDPKTGETTTLSLKELRELNAYVLLGDPGMGKTVAFKQEADASDGRYLTARDLQALGRPEWKNKTLFIDALDETRAGAGDGRTALDRIRAILEQLGRPRFRLACRAADWLGASDRDALARVAATDEITVVHLDPLSDEQILAILRDRQQSAETFLNSAKQHGLGDLLKNPQTLAMLIEAVSGGQWPVSREQTYELACLQLTKELNSEHRQAKRGGTPPAPDQLLNAAGYLCAIQLLAALLGYALDEDVADKDFVVPDSLNPSSALPLRAALKTKLFKSSGEERLTPVHRSVAEYLGARYLAAQVEHYGLPLGRVLALMRGADGGIVAGLRGLHAWLAVHCRSQRIKLIDNDPLGVVLYGDVRNFPVSDKQHLLTALHQEAKQYSAFRWENWSASPFGAFATADMVPIFRAKLTATSRDEADQALVGCVLDALRYGAPLPELASELLAIVCDATYGPQTRTGALRAYLHIAPEPVSALLPLLEEIRCGKIEDRDDELLGILLNFLYPAYIPISQLVNDLHDPKAPSLLGAYRMFWTYQLPKKISAEDAAFLENEFNRKPPRTRMEIELLWHCISLGKIEGQQLPTVDISDQQSQQEKISKNKTEWLQYFHELRPTIRDATVHPQVLYELALAYFDETKGNSPQERLENFLNNDRELIEAAFEGFKAALFRSDLPEVKDIVKLKIKGKIHYIHPPCMAGMDLIWRDKPESLLTLPDSQLTRMLAFYYTFAAGDNPAWIKSLVHNRPDLVSKVLIAYVLPMLRANKEYVTGLYALAYDKTYTEVARLAILDLLTEYPLRSRKNQLQQLKYLLVTGFKHLDRSKFLGLIEKKLTFDSMDAAQRIYWLACGLAVAPQQYETILAQYVGKSQTRSRHLAGFFHDDNNKWLTYQDLPETSLGLLIKLLGPDCHPERPRGDARLLSPAMPTAKVVRTFISRLGSMPSDTAAGELRRLLALPKLSLWFKYLRHAQQTQRVSQRETLFPYPSTAEVCLSLANLQPANAADLAALALEYLRELADEIRHGNTDVYKNYWNEDSNGKPTTLKPENSCRDILLGKLRSRLAKLNIDAQPEGHYADDKRADIRVSYVSAGKSFNVPIEIKKEQHANLWRAIHEQLVAKYTRDPGADGHGIYLVFWFGGKNMPPAPAGPKPHSAKELEDRLISLLTLEERKQIDVCVIDCDYK